jgi:hypothetical protein
MRKTSENVNEYFDPKTQHVYYAVIKIDFGGFPSDDEEIKKDLKYALDRVFLGTPMNKIDGCCEVISVSESF